jgi:hydrogenase/urease accessory protein HupE
MVFLVLALCVVSTCRAHPAPFSVLDVYLEEAGLRGVLTLHDFDAAHELGLPDPDALLDASLAQSQRAKLLEIVSPRLRWRVDGVSLAPRWGAITVLGDQHSLRMSFDFGSSVPGRVDLEALLFPYDRQHQTFVNVYEAGRLRHQAILDSTRDSLSYYRDDASGRRELAWTFVASGFRHILTGPDHILFVAGLLLLGGGLRRLAITISAFTVGHSLTLSLAAMGAVHLAPRVVEPAIALSIVMVGLDNLMVVPGAKDARERPRQRDWRPWLAAGFGMVHGFGFALVLLEFGLPRDALVWSLASFNVGVELGQLAVVLPIAGLLGILRRRCELAAIRVARVGSATVALVGAIWFIQRVWLSGATS